MYPSNATTKCHIYQDTATNTFGYGMDSSSCCRVSSSSSLSATVRTKMYSAGLHMLLNLPVLMYFAVLQGGMALQGMARRGCKALCGGLT